MAPYNLYIITSIYFKDEYKTIVGEYSFEGAVEKFKKSRVEHNIISVVLTDFNSIIS